jgi:hypothetical protein
VPAFTVGQPEDGLEVLEQRARELGVRFLQSFFEANLKMS